MPRWAERLAPLTTAGQEAEHGSELGDPRGRDWALMQRAWDDAQAPFTHGRDDGPMLGLPGADGPGVQIEGYDLQPRATPAAEAAPESRSTGLDGDTAVSAGLAAGCAPSQALRLGVTRPSILQLWGGEGLKRHQQATTDAAGATLLAAYECDRSFRARFGTKLPRICPASHGAEASQAVQTGPRQKTMGQRIKPTGFRR